MSSETLVSTLTVNFQCEIIYRMSLVAVFIIFADSNAFVVISAVKLLTVLFVPSLSRVWTIVIPCLLAYLLRHSLRYREFKTLQHAWYLDSNGLTTLLRLSKNFIGSQSDNASNTNCLYLFTKVSTTSLLTI